MLVPGINMESPGGASGNMLGSTTLFNSLEPTGTIFIAAEILSTVVQVIAWCCHQCLLIINGIWHSFHDDVT